MEPSPCPKKKTTSKIGIVQKGRITLNLWGSKRGASPDTTPPISPRQRENDKVLGVPKSKSLSCIVEEAKLNEKRDVSAQEALVCDSAEAWTRPNGRKKGSLADIYFMTSPLHAHAKTGEVDAIVGTCQVRRQALSDQDYFAWLNDGSSNKNGQTALHVAVQHEHVEAAKILCRLGCKLEMQDKNGRSCLLYCGRYGQLDLLRFFLRRCNLADLEKDKDVHGNGVLHLAAVHGHAHIVEYLVGKKGCGVNIQNDFGETPLHKAARVDDEKLVKLLLKLDADTDVIGSNGKAKHVAQSEAVISCLRKLSLPKASPPVKSDPVSIALRYDHGNDDDGDDNSSFEMTPAEENDVFSKLRASTPVGESPRSDVMRLKLLRAFAKSHELTLSGFDEPCNDDAANEVLRTRHKLIQQKLDFILSPRANNSVLADPKRGDGVVVEAPLRKGAAYGSGTVEYRFEAYQHMQEKHHFNYVCKSFASTSGPVAAIISVMAVLQSGKYRGLLRYSKGYTTYELPGERVALIQKEFSCPLSEAIRLYLEENALSADECLVQMPSKAESLLKGTEASVKPQRSRSRTFSALRKPAVNCLWTHVDGISLGMELVALELKLRLAKKLCVGVIRVLPGQTEAEAMQNPMSPPFEDFLSLLGNSTETLGWSGYSGGVSTKESGTMFYSRFQGIEIVFHACPLLTEEQRRQFIGNDKVLIYFLDQWRADTFLAPKFRGNVNTVAITVRPVSMMRYHFQSFHRLGMSDVPPALPEGTVELSIAMKYSLLTKIVNGHAAAYDLLYGDRLKRAWDEDLAKLAEKYFETGKKNRKT